MNGVIYACPMCTVLKPNASVLDSNHGLIAGPWRRIGSRSGKVFFARSTGCSHGPFVPEIADDNQATLTWNAWVPPAAEERAKQLKLTPRRRALFFYVLGLATMPEVMATPEDPILVEPSTPAGELPSFVDLEDRRRTVPMRKTLPAVGEMRKLARSMDNLDT